MAPRLCKACSSIPADFWCHSHDYKEYVGELSYTLQSLGNMRIEAQSGCQLCAILLSSLHDVRQIDDYRPKGNDEMLYLRRARPFPDRAIAIGIGGSRGKHHVSRTFFSRIPVEWASELTDSALITTGSIANYIRPFRQPSEKPSGSKPHSSFAQTYQCSGAGQQPRLDEELVAHLPK